MDVKLNRRTFLIVSGTALATTGIGKIPASTRMDSTLSTPPLHVLTHQQPDPPARPKTAAIQYVEA